ncbi:hypothetical protein [Candidatus Enterovibrio escicola]|uniref:Mobile element protein n=1 Tax=Candidatus Enterovibrio escicola TaxID=1927127 RepID=A0A2A5T7G0_9GAMM|nr:hypothetical protein [Candidatus Enterovibrio escacola]PCS24066.1 Mobile element protein [Candidatus Enterovibrio escacola]
MNKLDVVSTDIEKFYQLFLPVWKKHRISGVKTVNKPSRLSISEIMTIKPYVI